MGDGHPQQTWLPIRNPPQHKVSPSVDVLQKFVLPACLNVQVPSDWRNRYTLQLESEVFYPSGSGSPPKDISSVPGLIALWQTVLRSVPVAVPVGFVGILPDITRREHTQKRPRPHGDDETGRGIEIWILTPSKLGRTGRLAAWLGHRNCTTHCPPVPRPRSWQSCLDKIQAATPSGPCCIHLRQRPPGNSETTPANSWTCCWNAGWVPPVDIPDVSLVEGGVAGFPRPELLMVLLVLVVELLWMYYHGHAVLSVDMVSTSPVPFLLVVEGSVQPPGRREGMSHCLPRWSLCRPLPSSSNTSDCITEWGLYSLTWP